MPNEKDNLVLVNGFYTNSIILKGLVDFLDDRFNVHFIDLPGFCAGSPPLEEVNLESFARFGQDDLDRVSAFVRGQLNS